MPSKEERKEAIRKFKERKPAVGIFAVRCGTTGDVWVGASRNLDATRTGAWFALRLGSYPHRGLQQEWNRHGEPAFAYEVLDTLDDDVLAMSVGDVLKEKRVRWVEQLAAKPL